jgi:hypothetical protein
VAIGEVTRMATITRAPKAFADLAALGPIPETIAKIKNTAQINVPRFITDIILSVIDDDVSENISRTSIPIAVRNSASKSPTDTPSD